MNPIRLPGNEPDPGDMSIDPTIPAPNDQPGEHDLPENEADKLGDFA